MEFEELIRCRCAVRKYKSQKVEAEKLQKILEAGRIAPTGGNRQSQRLIVIQENDGMQKIAKAANIFQAPLAIVVCGDKSSAWTRKYDGKDLAETDAGIVTTHMMLEAVNLGLGTVWICNFEPSVLRMEFNIPAEWDIVNILAIGYPDGALKPSDRFDTERKKIEDIVFNEKLPG